MALIANIMDIKKLKGLVAYRRYAPDRMKKENRRTVKEMHKIATKGTL